MVCGDLKIHGNGYKGDDGSNGYGYNSHAKQFAVNGMNGEPATAPSPGEAADTVHVMLNRAAKDGARHPPGYIMVTVDKHPHQCVIPHAHSKRNEEFVHDLGNDGNIIISACGGDGGRGAKGGNGQGGGHGRSGTMANRQMGGTNGEHGGNGGNAGDGSSGAHGGRGGEVKLYIKEDDMDLLLALKQPIVQGGKGGQAGTHGTPGLGGQGGIGGGAFSWTETVRMQNNEQTLSHTLTRTNTAGLDGASGQPGIHGRSILENGKNGPNGSVQIFIDQNGNITGPFASPFQLELVDFDVTDGNDDGIFEFGEDIILHNIRVRNSGGTPSPKHAEVTMQGIRSSWISPVTTLKLPKYILNNSTTTCPGTITLRAQRKNTVPADQPLIVSDTFSVTARMSKIDRELRQFRLSKSITLQHPIQISKPRYLRCLTVNQEAAFSWTVTNDSRKDLGIESKSGREIRLMVNDEGNLLNFSAADSRLLDQSLVVPVNFMAAGQSNHIELIVKVPNTASAYQKTRVRVSLQLTPPDGSAVGAIQTFDLPVQVSNQFHHNPEAKVLLVTNSETSSGEVESWCSLICDRLGMEMDIWNVSLNGHLELISGPNIATRRSLFDLYKGKTIIMLGNSFEYFSRGQRKAMDLIDQKDLAPAALVGTSLFWAGLDVDDLQLRQLPHQLLANSSPLTRKFTTIKKLVQAIVGSRDQSGFYSTKFVCFPARKGNDKSRCAAKAERARKLLKQQVPNLRFIITWTSIAESAAGEIEVMPCTPYDLGRFVITRPAVRRFEEINGFCALLSLPFATRLQILWEEWEQRNPTEKATTPERRAPAPKGLSNIVEYDIIIELTRFTTNPPWPDCIRKEDLISHMGRLEKFFTYERDCLFSRDSIGPVTAILGNIKLLADFCSGSCPLRLTFATRRKNLLFALTAHIDAFLASHYRHLEGRLAEIQLDQYVAQRTTKMRSETLANRKHLVVQGTLAKVAVGLDINISDATEAVDVEMLDTIVYNEQETLKWRAMNTSHELQLGQDLAHAKKEVNDMFRLHSFEEQEVKGENADAEQNSSLPEYSPMK